MVATAKPLKSDITRAVEIMRQLMAEHGFDCFGISIDHEEVNFAVVTTVKSDSGGGEADVSPVLGLPLRSIDNNPGRDLPGEAFADLLRGLKAGLTIAREGIAERERNRHAAGP